MIRYCPGCFEKQRKIDALTEEIQSLKAKLRYLERKEQEGYFGSSTPSSKVPFKANATKDNQNKRGGAKKGHPGHGRREFDESEADEVIALESEVGDRCPQCGGPLQDRGSEEHSVIDIPPLQSKRELYVSPKQYCPRCRRTFHARLPGVLSNNLLGNQLLATTATMHYLHGVPMGRICAQFGLGLGTLIDNFHRLGKLFASVPGRLIEQYRQAPVKHADETGWPDDGQRGYVWLFATVNISIFLFRKTRSSQVPREVFGDKPLPGTLVVDRYSAYNKAPCALQYCFAHLLREVEDLEKEFSEQQEVKAFVGVFAPLLATAMHLRALPIPDAQFYEQAARVKTQILEVVHAPAQHLAIGRIQEIFHHHQDRMYRWAEDRQIPADNNLSERDLRLLVVARKVSFGSQSEAGANTRGILMTVLHTLKKRASDACAKFKAALDHLAKDPTLDPFPLLFPSDTS
ncbi:MAG TPA: IS66 family transposase [Thermodesulfobacteriota bacterium]|nr:IS66 family transposase [Thermodesulfobacteriota bacterium]